MKRPRFQQSAAGRPQSKFFGKGCMRRGKNAYPAAEERFDRGCILRSTDLVHCNHLRIHRPKKQHRPLGFRCTAEDIRAPADIELRRARKNTRDLTALVTQTDPRTSIRCCPNQFTQKRCLAAARPGKNQHGAVFHGRSRSVACPVHLPRNANAQRGYVAQRPDPAVYHCAAANAHANTARRRQITAAQLVRHRMHACAARRFQNRSQIRRSHRYGSKFSLSSRQKHARRSSQAQAKLLRTRALRRAEHLRSPVQFRRQQRHRRFESIGHVRITSLSTDYVCSRPNMPPPPLPTRQFSFRSGKHSVNNTMCALTYKIIAIKYIH